MTIPGPGRGDSTTLAGNLSRRRKTLNKNQVAAGAFTRPTRGKENPKKNRVQGHPLMSLATEGGEQWPMQRALPTKPTVHAPTTLWPCNIFGTVWCCPTGSWPKGTAPGSQPQRRPTSATGCDSDPSGLTMDGQKMVNTHSRSSSRMRKESNLKRRNYNTS